MTTQEIVKALRCCVGPNCNECPFKSINGMACIDDMLREAADLIEAQDELIKVLRTQIGKKGA